MICDNGQIMWPTFHGDSIEFHCKFTDLQGNAIPLANRVIEFAMRLDPKAAVCFAYDLFHTVRVPNDNLAKLGIAVIRISSEQAHNLIPGREYYFTFKLVDDSCVDGTDKITVGWGTRKVNQNLAIKGCDTNGESNIYPC